MEKVYLSDAGPKVSPAIYGFYRWDNIVSEGIDRMERIASREKKQETVLVLIGRSGTLVLYEVIWMTIAVSMITNAVRKRKIVRCHSAVQYSTYNGGTVVMAYRLYSTCPCRESPRDSLAHYVIV